MPKGKGKAVVKGSSKPSKAKKKDDDEDEVGCLRVEEPLTCLGSAALLPP